MLSVSHIYLPLGISLDPHAKAMWRATHSRRWACFLAILNIGRSICL